MFPLFTTRYLHVRHEVRDSQRRKWQLWARMLCGNFAEMTTSTPFKDLLHAANLRHGTDGFFSPLKIRRLRPGLNPRTWVLKASTLPLDHRSRYQLIRQPKMNFAPNSSNCLSETNSSCTHPALLNGWSF